MSGPHTVIAHKKWSLIPDREPDAEAVTHAMECAVCGDRSDASGSWEPPQTWVLEHSGRNPSHHSYREIITRPWRTFMND
ncbi:hypothetical protein SEA_AMETHYST_48 [Streptomyces phage Amethyst]|uniref:DUF7848 domain-containing protein n=1 Tax=Streptomyces phage Amethyst TaxID=2041205 RepID=A0A291LH08_9CAUD|nr:hypothetical protein KGG83_gp48 [Streptomyces phage Amethyst]ATI18670.1 hypothetical protein SEA_AMETHYST_48 [Streptomyces phage Amethyst]